MIEIYEGNEENRTYIQRYLNNIRSLAPFAIVTLPNYATVANIIESGEFPHIDIDLFWNAVNRAKAIIQDEYSEEFSLIDPRRYIFGISEKPTALGGFHSKWSVGYHQLYQAGFGVLLNPSRVKDVRVRTAEAVRSYLHDCLHYSSFHLYAIRPHKSLTASEAKRSEPKVYRRQYGFSFRNCEGVAYSDKELTARVPNAINLNLLMDGIVMITAGSLIKRLFTVENLTPFDRSVFAEVIGEPIEASGYEHALKFFQSVTRPTQLFIEKWGGDEFLKIAFQAMMTGLVDPLKTYFERKHGEDGAWENTFMSTKYRAWMDAQG
ncbi:hypothetical protein [Mesorhizobium sp. B1-1-8]|uniref:hypothetical protein n=1 Tax=Mesorhizobium sp. B1-1-8 TaxID=2589976 RepID=UPI00112611AA|nr:hypothetical protein [Mesorhizobium sp. B1-1-8]UCI07362.1 hypothetical protein FJ974_26860 [Mesorhizobium sp. B1-1-8]